MAFTLISLGTHRLFWWLILQDVVCRCCRKEGPASEIVHGGLASPYKTLIAKNEALGFAVRIPAKSLDHFSFAQWNSSMATTQFDFLHAVEVHIMRAAMGGPLCHQVNALSDLTI